VKQPAAVPAATPVKAEPPAPVVTASFSGPAGTSAQRLDPASPGAPTRPIAGLTRPGASASEAERFAYWSTVVKAGGGQVNPHGMTTVLGVRGLAADGGLHHTSVNRDYNDTFVILRPDGRVFEFGGSTHPGNEIAAGVPALGVGLLRPGSYVAQPHGQRFGSDSFAITTERGGGAVPGVRDADHDGLFSPQESATSQTRGDTMTGVLFHQNSAYSVGCQTFEPASWARFVEALGGPKKAFSYTLVEAAQP
jgi:hypothetical protein